MSEGELRAMRARKRQCQENANRSQILVKPSLNLHRAYARKQASARRQTNPFPRGTSLNKRVGSVDLVIPFGLRSGGGGIRTHGQAEPVNGFQDRPDQPLWHPSGRSDKMTDGKWQMANDKRISRVKPLGGTDVHWPTSSTMSSAT